MGHRAHGPQLHAQVQARYEKYIAELQADAARKVDVLSAEERQKRGDAEKRLRAAEQQLQEVRRRLEVATAEADTARAGAEDARAMLAQSSSLEASLRAANERLKEKLLREQELREKGKIQWVCFVFFVFLFFFVQRALTGSSESASHVELMQKWQAEIEEAQASKVIWASRLRPFSPLTFPPKGASERVASEAHAAKQGLLDRIAQLERQTAGADAQLTEARNLKDDFVFQLQMANERLKEKLRVSEEAKVRLLSELDAHEQALNQSVELQQQSDDWQKRARALELELSKAQRYKEDWMAEVKQRVVLEERGHAATDALRTQLDQARQRCAELDAALAGADQRHESASQELRARVRALEGTAAKLQEEQSARRRLEVALEESKARLLSAEADAHKLRGQLEEAQRGREGLSGVLQAQLKEKEAELARLSDQLRLGSVAEERAKERERERAQLTSELDLLRRRLEECEASLKAETRTRTSYETANVQLEKEIAIYRAAQADNLQERVQDLLNTSGSMAQQLSSASERQEQLADRLREQTAEAERLRVAVARMERQVEESAETARLWKQRYEQAQATCDKEDEVNRAMIVRHHDQQEQLAQLQRTVAQLQQEAVASAQGAEVLRADLSLRTQELGNVRAELAEVEGGVCGWGGRAFYFS